jgi:hypothetical protein
MHTHTFTTFAEAEAACGADDTVCGTVLSDGTPVYFVMPKNVTSAELRDRAFQVRHGRSPSATEVQLASLMDRMGAK